jgi:glucose/arabinose dehydrogenase
MEVNTLARAARILAVAAIVPALCAPAGARPSPDRGGGLPQVPVGFAVTVYGRLDGLVTSLAVGPDTRDPKATRLYVTDFAGGRVLAIDDIGGQGGPPVEFATGFRSPLGVLVGEDGTVFVTDAEAPRRGPFGTRTYGRVWKVTDTDSDGVADKKTILLKDLPNGRHNTNGMAFGPDGLLYVANGNSTDDGVEGGEPEAQPLSGSVVRVDPDASKLSAASLPRSAVVATGMRNLYDVAFSPYDEADLLIPMNGVDDAREGSTGGAPGDPIENSDDLLYLTDTNGGRDDFGFPSCLYNLEKRGNLKPYDNPNRKTIAEFGHCPVERVPRPVASFGLHVSADGAAFQTTKSWGKDFQNDLFVAEFGNFFGDEVVGHRVVRVEFAKTGQRVVRQSEFIAGVTPLDVTFDDAGAMYIADFTGTILKVDKLI